MRKDRITATAIGLVLGIAGTFGLRGCSLPIPTPFNPVSEKGDHVVIMVDDTSPSIPTGIILDSPLLRALKSVGKCSIVGIQEDFHKRQNYGPLLEKAGGAPALAILTKTGGAVHVGRLPTDMKALADLLTEHIDLPPPPPAHAWPIVLSNGSESQMNLDANGQPFVDVGGQRRLLTAKPDKAKFRTIKKYGDNFPVFPEAQWYDVNRDGIFAASNDDNVSWIYDQGSHGSCVGQGWVGALRRARVLAGMKDVKLSPTYLYSQINGNQDNGAIISDGIAALTKNGTCTFDLVKQDKIYQRQMPSGAKAEAQRFKLDDAYRCDSWEETCSALLTGRFIVVFGIQVGNTWGRFDQHGVSGHDRGPGNHCLLGDTLVSTEVPKEIIDLQIGDMVRGHDGRLHKVTEKLVNHYEGDMIEIKAACNLPIKLTVGHPVLVYRPRYVQSKRIPPGTDLNTYMGGMKKHVASQAGYDAAQPMWVRADEVEVGDYVLSAVPEICTDTQMPSWKINPAGRIHPLPIVAADSDLAWAFGYYIADGHNQGGKAIVYTIPANCEHDVARLVAVFAKLGLKAKVEPSPTYTRVKVFSSTLAASFSEWFGTESSNKRIPEFLYHGWDMPAVLNGLFCGDGCVTEEKETMKMSTVSPVLARQVWNALIAHGMHARISIAGRSAGCYANAKTMYDVSFSYGDTLRHAKFWNGYYAMPVRKIDRERYSGLVYNCEVEDAHSYHAGGMVSHNCIAADGLRKLPDGRWVLASFNSWGNDWGPFKNGRVYQDKMHLFGNGDQPDVCVIRRPGRDPQDPYAPPAYRPKAADMKLAF